MRVHICALDLPGVDCRVQKVVLDRSPTDMFYLLMTDMLYLLLTELLCLKLSRARDGRTTKNQRYILAAVEERDPYCRVHTSTPRVYRLFIITLHKVCGLSQRHYRSPVPNRLEDELTSDYRQSRLTSVLSDMTSSRSRGLLKWSVTKMMLVYYCYVDEDTKDSGMAKWHLSWTWTRTYGYTKCQQERPYTNTDYLPV